MLRLGSTNINKLYLGSTEIKKAYLGSTLVFDSTVVVSNLYNDVSVMYTLRRPAMTTLWTNAIAKIRRTSDNATAFVFIDGSNINDTISLSSFISTSSNTTPSATTLSTWVGANNAFVEEWIGITPNNTIDNNKTAKQTTTGTQPQFISSGAIITKNSKPTIDFLSSSRHLNSNVNNDLDSSSDFTIFTISSNNINTGEGVLISTSNDDNNLLQITNDRRTQKRLTYTRVGGVYTFSNLLVQQDSLNQRILSLIKVNKNLKGYYNGNFQESNIYTGNYTNNNIFIGARNTAFAFLNGTIQEITIFPSDKTSDLTDLHNDINSYYSIF